MTRYFVVKSDKRWVVKKGSKIISKHNKKSTAMRKAMRKANKGDSVQAQKKSGKFGKERTKKVYGRKGDK